MQRHATFKEMVFNIWMQKDELVEIRRGPIPEGTYVSTEALHPLEKKKVKGQVLTGNVLFDSAALSERSRKLMLNQSR